MKPIKKLIEKVKLLSRLNITGIISKLRICGIFKKLKLIYLNWCRRQTIDDISDIKDVIDIVNPIARERARRDMIELYDDLARIEDEIARLKRGEYE